VQTTTFTKQNGKLLTKPEMPISRELRATA